MRKTSSPTTLSLIIILITILLTACVAPTPMPTPVPPTETQIIPSATPIPPSETPIPQPTFTETVIPPSPTVVPPTETPSSTNEQQTVLIYLIGIDDNGKSGKLIGCGDSVIPVKVIIKPTTGVLRAALNSLLSVKDQYYGESGLYNALYQSNLQVGNVTISGGQAVIRLTGTLMMGGECDIPRVEAQLTEIALQFSTVTSVSVYINDVPLKDALSLK
jgi:hypothetical protein